MRNQIKEVIADLDLNSSELLDWYIDQDDEGFYLNTQGLGISLEAIQGSLSLDAAAEYLEYCF